MRGPCPLNYGANTCFVATAAYSPNAKELDSLYYFRNNKLASKKLGRFLIKLYYKVGPSLAKIVSVRDKFKAAARKVITPFVRHYQSMV